MNSTLAGATLVYMHLTQELFFRAGPCCASIDGEVAHWFRAHLTPLFADYLLALSGPGGPLWIASAIALAVAFLAWTRRWHTMGLFCASVPGGALLGEALKLIVQRQRPFISGPSGEWGGYSFPSGHTTAATVLYVFLAMALVPLFKRRRWRFLAISAATLLIMGVAFSRVALGAHYLSDVLGAMGLGTTWVALCSAGAQKLRARRLAQPDILADSPVAIIGPENQESSDLAA